MFCGGSREEMSFHSVMEVSRHGYRDFITVLWRFYSSVLVLWSMLCRPSISSTRRVHCQCYGGETKMLRRGLPMLWCLWQFPCQCCGGIAVLWRFNHQCQCIGLCAVLCTSLLALFVRCWFCKTIFETDWINQGGRTCHRG